MAARYCVGSRTAVMTIEHDQQAIADLVHAATERWLAGEE
jgi:hypothetical protein